MNKLIAIAIAFSFILPFVYAVEEPKGHVLIVQPVQKQIFEGNLLDLGLVGPGQKIEIEISRSSNIFDFRNVEEVWDRLVIDDNTLPIDWKAEYSLRYEANPKAFVIIGENAPDGEYSFSLHTDRDYGSASNYPVRFNAKVRVSKDVFDLTVLQKSVLGGVEQPSIFSLTFVNKGSANDAFDLEVIKGLPTQWTFKKQVFVPHNSERTIQYEVLATERGDWDVGFKASSLSSEKIYDEDSGELIARTNLLQDMRSVGSGVILFPYVEQTIYYFLGFVASNFLS